MKPPGKLSTEFAVKTIVITGASSGVGRAMAVELAWHGAKLLLVARRQDALKEVVKLCNEVGGVALAMPTDVTDAEALQNVAAKANEFGGGIDVWINNAGVLAAGDFTDTPVEIHQHVLHTNLFGYMHGAYAVLPFFKKQGYGLLINNISVGGWMPVPYAVAYSASKFGLTGFSEALRGELTKYSRITICDLFPAFLDTPGIQHAANYTGKQLMPAPPVYDPQEVARAVVSVVRRPRQSVTIGSVSTFLKVANSVAPSFTRWATAKLIENYLKTAEPTETTSGNVFRPVEFGTAIHGGWARRFSPSSTTVTSGLALAAFAAGLIFMLNGKRSNSTK